MVWEDSPSHPHDGALYSCLHQQVRQGFMSDHATRGDDDTSTPGPQRELHCKNPCHTYWPLKMTVPWKECFLPAPSEEVICWIGCYWTVWCSWCYLACTFVWGLLLLLHFFQIYRSLAWCKDIHDLSVLQCSLKQLDTQEALKESEKWFANSFLTALKSKLVWV